MYKAKKGSRRVIQETKKKALTLELSKFLFTMAGGTSHALTSHCQLLRKCSNQVILLLKIPLDCRNLLESL